MKEDIVQQFLKKGKLLTPEALDEIAEKGAASVIGEGVVVTKRKPQPETKNEIKILKNVTSTPSEISASDFSRFYKSKYEKMKNIIAGRLQKDFVSLNKIDNYREEVYAIGIVRDIREKDGKIIMELEDPTASIPVVFEGSIDDVELDDVIAVRAVSAKNMMFGKQIIFPDVPLRQPKTSTGRICVAPGLHLDEAPRQDVERIFTWIENQNIDNIFFVGDLGDATEFEALVRKYCNNKNVFVIPGEKDARNPYPSPPVKFSYDRIISLSNPSMVEINGIKILLAHNFNPTMLKKRYLGKAKRITEEDNLVVEEVPDIVLFNHSPNTQIVNYKSITLANPGSVMTNTNVIVIDFLTREAEQITI